MLNPRKKVYEVSVHFNYEENADSEEDAKRQVREDILQQLQDGDNLDDIADVEVSELN
jgi:hypothetical protein